MSIKTAERLSLEAALLLQAIQTDGLRGQLSSKLHI